MKFFKKIFSLPRSLFLLVIRLYQKTLSPDHGLFKFLHPLGYCRFYPTCSEYSYQSIKKKRTPDRNPQSYLAYFALQSLEQGRD